MVAEDPELTGLALEYLRDVAGELQGTAGQQAQQVLEDARAMADDPEQVAKFEAQLLNQLPKAGGTEGAHGRPAIHAGRRAGAFS